MESSPYKYQELSLLIDTGWFVRHSETVFFPVEAAQILETKEYLKGNATICAESYWVLDATGPRLSDFGEIEREIRKVIPPMAGKWGVGPYLAKNLK